jgi:hypothetical protein
MSEVIATGMTVTDSKKATDRILAKIRALLAKADGTDNEHEAAAFREHAEKLMREYRVAEEHLIAANPDSVKPVVTEADLFMYGATPFGQQYINMMHAVARHTGIRDHYIYLARKADGRTVLRAFLVGYEADTRYADALFTSAQMVFQARLEPSVDPKADDRENVYRLRSAGIERNRIARMLWNLDTHASYAEEFVNELGRRLRRAQDGADSAGGTLVLAGRSERVDEAFYDRFPELRPSTTLVKSEPCEKCTKTKHASGKCQAHRPRAYTKADDDRWERRHNSATALQARSAGRQAAAEVELRGTTPAKRLGEDATRSAMRDLTGLEISE